MAKDSITVEELPKLSGTAGKFIHWNNDQTASGIFNVKNFGGKFPSTASENSTNADITIAFGGDQPHGNISPSLGAYVWHRTA